jgi:Glycosyl hydrolase catalytic core/Ricin-type beta-trefoil lectin domain-like
MSNQSNQQSAMHPRRRSAKTRPPNRIESLEPRTLLNGTFPAFNVAKFQSVTADSNGTGVVPGMAVDGIVSNDSRWFSDSTGPHWLEVQLSAAFPVGSAQLFFGKDDAFPVSSFSIQYLDNGAWQTVHSANGNTATDLNVVFPQAVTNATRFRLFSTDAVLRVKEFALYPPAGPVGHALGTDLNLNLASSSAAVGSSTLAPHYPIQAVDGYVNDNSRWLTPGTPAVVHSLTLTMQSLHRIGSLHLYSGFGQGTATTNLLTTFQLEYDDGTTWLPLPIASSSSGIVTGHTIDANTSPELVVSFTPVETKSVRISFNGGYGRVREAVLLPANVTPSGSGYPVGTSVKFVARPTTSYAEYADHWHRITSRATGNALVSSATGAEQSNAATGAKNKQYELLYSYAWDAYRIRDRATGLAIEVQDASTAQGAAIVEGVYSASPHQLWKRVPTSDGHFQFVNLWSGMALATSGTSTTVSQQPRDLATNPTDAQEWLPVFEEKYFKKGVGGRPFLNSFDTSWAYNWGSADPGMVISEPEKFFAPMAWGGNVSFLSSKYHEYHQSVRPSYLMALNEPDKVGQANISLERSLELWPTVMAMDVPIVGPNPGDPNWHTNFADQADALGYRADYAGYHWYASPNVSSLLGQIDNVKAMANGRDVWLTEFSVVDWSGGSGNWSEESNYNFIIEFLWRAQTKASLEKYSLFVFVDEPAPQPWTLSNPRSSSFDQTGAMTPFGKAYATWDGVTTINNETAYLIHNKSARHRLRNGGTATPSVGTIRQQDNAVQWKFVDAGGGKRYIVSLADGRRLRYDGTTLDYASPTTTGASVEWTLSHEANGWHNIIHPATSKYLRLIRTNDANNGPVSQTFSMATATDASNTDSPDWFFVKPFDAAPVTFPTVTAATFQTLTGPQNITIQFDSDVSASVSASDLMLLNTTTNQAVAAQSLVVTPVTASSIEVSWTNAGGTVPNMLSNGNYVLTLTAGTIVSDEGAPMVNDYNFGFRFINGDADDSGMVGFDDLLALARHFGQSERNFQQGDFNLDSSVDFNDLLILAQNYGVAGLATSAVANRQMSSVSVRGRAPTALPPASIASPKSKRDRLIAEM